MLPLPKLSIYTEIEKLVRWNETVYNKNMNYRVDIPPGDKIGYWRVPSTPSRDYMDSIIKNMKDAPVVVRLEVTIELVNQAVAACLGTR